MSGEWKKEYEDHADQEHDAMKSESLATLIRRLERRQFGDYFGLWDAIGAKQDLSAVGWRMLDFIRSPAEEYLQKYHCARVLLVLMGNTRYEAADLTVAHRHPEAHLAEIEQDLVRAIGPRRS